MKLHYVLCVSTTTFILPVIYYNCINFCNILIISSICCSLLFWINPIKQNFYHKLDGIVAKITYGSFLYNTTVKLYQTKYLYDYWLVNVFVILLFVISNHYSKNWCSPRHIFFHTMFHIVGMISTIYAYF